MICDRPIATSTSVSWRKQFSGCAKDQPPQHRLLHNCMDAPMQAIMTSHRHYITDMNTCETSLATFSRFLPSFIPIPPTDSSHSRSLTSQIPFASRCGNPYLPQHAAKSSQVHTSRIITPSLSRRLAIDTFACPSATKKSASLIFRRCS